MAFATINRALAIAAAQTCGESWTVYASPEAERIATPLAKGCYQAALLTGGEAWSGSTLIGTARRWGSRYHASREVLLARLADAGLDIRYVRVRGGRPHGGGRKVAVISVA